MQICCSICKDLFIHHSEVVVTECGHLYHSACVFEWLKNQKTCPQCRASVKREKVHRVYFDVENDTDVDASSLQYKIDKLLYESQVKDGKIKTLDEKVKEQEGMINALRKHVRDFEEKIEALKTTNWSLNTEVKNKIKEIQSLEEKLVDYDMLKNKVSTLSRVEEIVNGTVEAVTKMVSTMPMNASTIRQLSTMVEVLKKQIHRNDIKNLRIREEAQQLRKDVNKINREKKIVEEQVQMLSSANSKLEEDLKHFKELAQKSQKVDDAIDLVSPLPKKLKPNHFKLNERKTDLENDRENNLSVINSPSPFNVLFPSKKSVFSLDKKVINKLEVKKKSSDDLDSLEIIPGPSKTLAAPLSISNDVGIFKKKELSRHKSVDSNPYASSKFVFNGMGGSSKVNLAIPTPREELMETVLKKNELKKSILGTKRNFEKAKSATLLKPAGVKPISSFFRDPS